ncbi:hypothetical protein [Pseudoxanthomonas mexicana]
MSIKPSPSQKYQLLLDALDTDTSDVVEVAPLFDRASIVQKAEVRAGQIRRAMAKKDMQLARAVVLGGLSEVVFSKSRGIFGLLASRDPAFGSKFSIAFRNGSELNDDEIREILKEAQSLGVDLEELAKSVK